MALLFSVNLHKCPNAWGELRRFTQIPDYLMPRDRGDRLYLAALCNHPECMSGDRVFILMLKLFGSKALRWSWVRAWLFAQSPLLPIPIELYSGYLLRCFIVNLRVFSCSFRLLSAPFFQHGLHFLRSQLLRLLLLPCLRFAHQSGLVGLNAQQSFFLPHRASWRIWLKLILQVAKEEPLIKSWWLMSDASWPSRLKPISFTPGFKFTHSDTWWSAKLQSAHERILSMSSLGLHQLLHWFAGPLLKLP